MRSKRSRYESRVSIRRRTQILVTHHIALAVRADDQQVLAWVTVLRPPRVERVEVLRRDEPSAPPAAYSVSALPGPPVRL